MPRTAIFNFMFGFGLLFLGMCAGFFVVNDAEQAFMQSRQEQWLLSWTYTLLKSAHGHLSSFALMHILFGLTLPYSRLSQKIFIGQTLGLCLGSFAMGALLPLRALLTQSPSGMDWLGLGLGLCLSLCTLSVATHIYGLGLKFFERNLDC